MYVNLYDYKFYLNLMNGLGFKEILMKDVFINQGKLNLRLTTPACIICFKKIKNTDFFSDIKIKNCEIDHFKPSNYIKNQQTLINDLVNKLILIKTKLRKLKISDQEKLYLCNPLIKDVLNYKINDPFLIIQKNLIKSFQKVNKIINKYSNLSFNFVRMIMPCF